VDVDGMSMGMGIGSAWDGDFSDDCGLANAFCNRSRQRNEMFLPRGQMQLPEMVT